MNGYFGTRTTERSLRRRCQMNGYHWYAYDRTLCTQTLSDERISLVRVRRNALYGDVVRLTECIGTHTTERSVRRRCQMNGYHWYAYDGTLCTQTLLDERNALVRVRRNALYVDVVR